MEGEIDVGRELVCSCVDLSAVYIQVYGLSGGGIGVVFHIEGVVERWQDGFLM